MKLNLLPWAIFNARCSCLLALIFLQMCSKIVAQPVIEWEKTFGGSTSDILSSVRPTSDGGYIVGGRSTAPAGDDKTQASRGGYDYWIVKVSSNGTKQWDRTYGGDMDDHLVQTFQASDGGYVLAGYSKSDAGEEKGANDKVTGSGRRGDFWIVKTDANGNKIWDKTIGGTSEDVLEDAKQTTDGGYILAGSTLSGIGADKQQPSAGSRDFWLVRIDASGNILWTQSIGTSNSERFTNINVNADGSYILGGGVRPLTANDAQAFVAKVSATGTVLWTKDLAIPSTEIQDIIPTSDGGYLAAIQDLALSDGPYTIIKLNSLGTIVWQKAYVGGPTTNPWPSATLYAVRPTPDGGFLIGGASNEQAGNDKSENRKGRGGTDYWVIKIDANGARQWDKTIGGLSSDDLFHLELTADGGYILGGISYSDVGADKSEPLRGSDDYWLVKLSPPPTDTRLVFTAASLDFDVIQGASTAPKSVLLNAFSGTPAVTLTEYPDASWLVLPAPAAGSLSFGISAAGLAPGTYHTSVVAAAPGYISDTLEVNLTVKPTGAPVTIRIDAGGKGYTTSDGRVFGPDQYYAGPDRVHQVPDGNEILYTSDDVLYRTERSSDSFRYDIPATNGKYMVVLHFAEIWFGPSRPKAPGQRLFNVDIEGGRKLTEYDIYTKSGNALAAIEEAFPVDVSDGHINIVFSSGSANFPTVAAIEVIPQDEYFRATQALPALADAYVHTGFPDENFGTTPELIVKSGESNVTRNTYVKFQLNGFEKIISARLRIYGVNVESTMKVGTAVYSIDNDSWTETGITYNNAPQPPVSLLELSHTTTNNNPGYREIDVTGFVQSQLAGDKVVSLMVKNPSFVNKKLVFHSRENASGFAPQLLVTSDQPVASGARKAAGEELSDLPLSTGNNGSTIFPNPVKKHFELKLSGSHEGETSLQMIDMSGRAYPVTVSVMQSGTRTVDVSRHSLKPGMYLLKIQSARRAEMVKVMVAE